MRDLFERKIWRGCGSDALGKVARSWREIWKREHMGISVLPEGS